MFYMEVTPAGDTNAANRWRPYLSFAVATTEGSCRTAPWPTTLAVAQASDSLAVAAAYDSPAPATILHLACIVATEREGEGS